MRTAPTRADRRSRTRSELITVADRRFSTDGYHATSLDAVADEAGFTKGAVYSNFSSKEDLFFAVYERRVERSLEAAAHVADADDVDAAVRERVAAAAARRDRDDGWLAASWSSDPRAPPSRAPGALRQLHERAMRPFATAHERLATERGPAGLDPGELATVFMGVNTILGLERLTRPDAIGPELPLRVHELFLDALGGPREAPPPRGDGDGPQL